MNRHGSFAQIGVGCLAVLVSMACGNKDAGTEKAQGKTRSATVKQPATPFVPVDACSLVSKSEVEELSKKRVEEPQKETAGNLVTCSYGDPRSPQVGGRRLSKVVGIAVFTGQEGTYYAGPVAQAKDTYEMARKNSGADETVNGLGESAYWDKAWRSLSVLKSRYFISVTVEDEGGAQLAKEIISKALSRLPE